VDNVTAPPQAICHLSAVMAQALAVGQYKAIDPVPSQGCVVFPANAGTDSAEYLLVPQTVTQTPDFTSSFRLLGGTPAAAAARVAAAVRASPESPAQQFHTMLRGLEAQRAYATLVPGGAAVRAQAPPPAVINVGDQRTFRVLSTLRSGSSSVPVPATAQSVGQRIALFVDNAAPAGGMAVADYNALRDVFDQRLYGADTAAFGRESDIDGNGLVIVLMTNVVNKLVTASDCFATGYIAGYFYGADIDPVSAPLFNNAEIFFTMIADPAGTLSCPHSVSQVNRVVPTTLVHEFQHMISYNQHVMIRHGRPETLWLNEGMSHYAEELGGRTFLPGDSTSYCAYVTGDLRNASDYLIDPGTYPLIDTTGTGGLANRGAGWLFVRYLVDRFAADTSLAEQNAVTRALTQTALTSTANVAQATGAPFATTVGEWALAAWASDLPGFTAPNALRYKTWAFRSAYPQLRARCGNNIPAAFPLTATADAGPSINLTGVMTSGSGGAYQRALQAPGAGSYTLLYSDSTGAQLKTTVSARLNVLRIR